MDFDRRISEIVEGAEKALAALAAEAAAARDYLGATKLLAIAQRVSEAGRGDPMQSYSQRAEGERGNAEQIEAPGADSDGSLRSPSLRVEGRNSKGTKPTYPRFKREDNTLVKIGWSKSDKATYEHRSPHDVLDRLIARIVETGKRGVRFTTEELMPLLDAEGHELPSYQAYLCLAWLVAQGLIERHGRQGYTIVDASSLPAAAESAWLALPKR